MKKISIIILNWNRLQETLVCLESVKSLNIKGYELETVIVDNGSEDGSLLKFKKLKNIKIISNRSNLGFAGGNNRGIEYALNRGADYVAIVNNDVTLEKNSLNELVKIAQKYPKLGAISPKIYFEKGFEFHKSRYKDSEKGNVIWYAGGVLDWNNIYGSARGVDEVDVEQFNKTEETDFATGACMFLSKEALKKVGFFDSRYFMYYEDTDLSNRLKKHGFNVIYNPKAIVWHKVAQSSGIGSELSDYFTTRNRMLFGLRYASMRTKIALIRESVKLLLNGRKWQKIGIRDYYLGRFGKGSWR